nr:thiol:disulfide interchange protein DsbA/DsbL [uncultured Glaciecola sp.]
MTKTSIVFFVTLVLSIAIVGCSKAPPEPSTPALSMAEADSQQALSPLLPVKWIEGTHYNVVADTPSEQKEIVEYFSFWCPACYRFETIANKMKPQLDSDVKFRKVHVNFMSFTTPEIQEQATKAMLVSRSLDMEELLNAAIFAHIHEQGKKIEGIADLKELFNSYDISTTDFENILNKTELAAAFTQNNDEIAQFKEYLKGVPNIIVNGKYQAKFSREMTEQDIVDLVNWLSQQQ